MRRILPKLKKEIFVTPDGRKVEITHGSGNIYADLGFPNPEEHKVKAGIVMEIMRLMEAKGLTQARLSKLAGVDQPRLSRIFRGQFRDISVERLLSIVNRMGHEVIIQVSAAESLSAPAQTIVVALPAAPAKTGAKGTRKALAPPVAKRPASPVKRATTRRAKAPGGAKAKAAA